MKKRHLTAEQKIEVAALDAKPDDLLLALHDRIHVIMDERAQREKAAMVQPHEVVTP